MSRLQFLLKEARYFGPKLLSGFGVVGFFSFIEHIQFIMDSFERLQGESNKYFEVLKTAIRFLSQLVDWYHRVVYTIVDLLPFSIPHMLVDVVFISFLSGRIARMFFRKDMKSINDAWVRLNITPSIYSIYPEQFKSMNFNARYRFLSTREGRNVGIAYIGSLLTLFSPHIEVRNILAVAQYQNLMRVRIHIDRAIISCCIVLTALGINMLDMYYRIFLTSPH